MSKAKVSAVPTAEEKEAMSQAAKQAAAVIEQTATEATIAEDAAAVVDIPVAEVEAEHVVDTRPVVEEEEVFTDPAAMAPVDMSVEIAAEAIENLPELTSAEEIIETPDLVVEEETVGEDFDKSEDNSQDLDEETLVAAENEAIYTLSIERLEAYLASDKDQDRIIQESRGGNFISSMTHEIYVPLSLFK